MNRKLRILWIRFLQQGLQGTEGLFGISNYLVKQGFHILTVVPSTRDLSEVSNQQEFQICQVYIPDTLPLSLRYLLFLCGSFMYVIHNCFLQFDLIIASSEMTLVGKTLSIFCNKPLVVDIRAPTLQAYYISSPWKFALGSLFERFAMTLADALIFVSSELSEYASRMYDISHKPRAIAPCGVRESFIKGLYLRWRKNISARARLAIPDNGLVVGYLGSLHSGRHLEKILYAVHKVWKEGVNVYLVIMGRGDAEDELKLLTRELGISERVFFVGYIPHDVIPSMLSGVDINLAYVPVLPNYRLCPPLKTVELMACGLATIATDMASQRTYITNEYNGLLVQDKVSDIADAIKRLADNPVFRRKLGENARVSVSNKFTWNKIAQNYISLFKKVLGEAPSYSN